MFVNLLFTIVYFQSFYGLYLYIPFASTATIHVLFCAHCIEDSSFTFKNCEALEAISQPTGALYDTMVSVVIWSGISNSKLKYTMQLDIYIDIN